MGSGVIQSEERMVDRDRGDDTYPLWEEGGGSGVDLPWKKAEDLASQDLPSLLAHARTVVLGVGKTQRSAALLDMALSSPQTSARLYVYAGRDIENDRRVTQALSQRAETVLVRLGHDLPLDWIVVDGHRGWLLAGPPEGDRRWILPVEGALARSLFQAFRVLFWHHASREALPDAAGKVVFGAALSAPFPDPGKEVALASGHLVVAGPAPDLMADAEIRIAPDGVVSAPASTLFLPPDPRDFTAPRRLAKELTRVVWSDTGLPRTAVSRERAVLTFVRSPISLQLEWPRSEAIEIYHRLSRTAQKPSFCFHAARRLADVTGRVLLEGAAAPAKLQDNVTLRAPTVIAALGAFDQATPERYPDPPALARRVKYQFKVAPVSVPPEAREADLVRAWRTADEWARRRVDSLREVLAKAEGEEKGVFDRLRTWLTGHDAVRQRRTQLRQQLDELGEAPPSQQAEQAVALLGRMTEAYRQTRQLVERSHAARVKAEEASAEAQQKAAWEARVRRAAEEIRAKRVEQVRCEGAEKAAAEDVDVAMKKLESVVEHLREERRAALTSEQEATTAALEDARREIKEAAEKAPRKQAERRAADIEGRLAKVARDLDSLAAWKPDAPAERGAVSRARAAQDSARQASRSVIEEIRAAEAIRDESFVFAPPTRPGQPDFPPDTPPPAVPAEAPPELGELFEDAGRRYLAVKTWEQVPRAERVARRLRAELVAFSAESGQHRRHGG